MADDDNKKPSGGDDKTFFALAILAVVVVALIPAVVALTMYFILRNIVTRRIEALLLFLTGVIGLALNPAAAFGEYGRWLVVLVSGNSVIKDGSRLDIPYLSLVFLSFCLTGLICLLRGSRLADLGLTRIGRKHATLKKKIDKTFSAPSKIDDVILPTAIEKRKAVTVVAPGGNLTIDAGAHSIDKNIPFGKRLFPIGIDKNGSPVTLSEDEIRMHTLIFGSTGSGKSKTIEAFAGGLLDLGWDGMVIDLKEDTKPGGLRDWCFDYSTHHSKPYQELRLSNPQAEYWFNPLEGMGADEMRDTILSLNEFEAAYWEAINKKMLGQVINLFMDAHEVDPIAFPYPTMRDLGMFMASASLPAAAKKMAATVLAAVPGRTRDDYNTVLNPSKDEGTSAAGLGARLTLIYDTVVGRTVLQPGAGRKNIDVTNAGITYVGLDSQGKPDLTKIISSAVLQRMSVYSSQRTTGANAAKTPPPRFIIVDEANWVDRNIVQNLLSRARGAGLSIVLCTQGPLDWKDPKGGDSFPTLSQNINVMIAMSQGEPESAEILAAYMGKREMAKTTHRVVDDETQDSGSVSMGYDYIIQPDQLREMGIGEAVIRVGKPTVRLTWASIRMRDPKAGPNRR